MAKVSVTRPSRSFPPAEYPPHARPEARCTKRKSLKEMGSSLYFPQFPSDHAVFNPSIEYRFVPLFVTVRHCQKDVYYLGHDLTRRSGAAHVRFA